MDNQGKAFAELATGLAEKTTRLAAKADEALQQGFSQYIEAQKATISEAERISHAVADEIETLAKTRFESALEDGKKAIADAFATQGVNL